MHVYFKDVGQFEVYFDNSKKADYSTIAVWITLHNLMTCRKKKSSIY